MVGWFSSTEIGYRKVAYVGLETGKAGLKKPRVAHTPTDKFEA